MQCFKQLSISFNPLMENALDELIQSKSNKHPNSRQYLYTSLKTGYFLSNEAKHFFRSKNVFPHVMIIFGHVGDPSKHKEDPHIHTDVFLENNKWIKTPFAINFELTDSESAFKWWTFKKNCEAFPILQPPPFKSSTFDYLYGSGITYKNYCTEDVICIDQFGLTATHPLLVRTDLPHNVYYNRGYYSRLSLSLRFPINQISSFEEAARIFD